MIANFWVIKWHDDFLMILPENLYQTLMDHLQKFALFSKVVISNDSFFIAEVLDYQKDIQPGFIKLPSPNRYLFIGEKNIFNDAIVNSDEEIWKKNNITDKLCIIYKETSLLFIPQMIDLEKHGGVSFEKGCYVGQEIVARTQHLGKLKRRLHRVTVQHHYLPGEELKNEQDEEIGVVVESSIKSYEGLAVLLYR